LNSTVTASRTEYCAAEKRLRKRYSLEANEHFFDVPALSLKGRALEVGSGEPLLMVHGGGGVSVQWVPLIAEITGRRIIAVDRPACGLSDPFNHRGVNIRDHAVGFLSGALDYFDIPSTDVVANSMGGLWSLWLSIDQPARVKSLALLGCPALMLDTSAPFVMRLLGVRGLNKLMWSTQKPSAEYMKKLHVMMGHKSEALENHAPEYWDAVYLAGTSSGYRDGWLTLLESVTTLTGGKKQYQMNEQQLSKVQTPTFLVWCDNDSFGGSEVEERSQAAITGSQLKVIPGGHLPWLDDTQRVSELVNSWLSSK